MLEHNCKGTAGNQSGSHRCLIKCRLGNGSRSGLKAAERANVQNGNVPQTYIVNTSCEN
jgi:hypothetical protein